MRNRYLKEFYIHLSYMEDTVWLDNLQNENYDHYNYCLDLNFYSLFFYFSSHFLKYFYTKVCSLIYICIK